ncbi:hypothetical protein [Kitasatospora sp. NPDC097691]|uniref:hypothetical protein n=1 Tax=Kitasatospora sp. NPDC097691 TaxID=3157231 RepID=UPI003322082E
MARTAPPRVQGDRWFDEAQPLGEPVAQALPRGVPGGERHEDRDGVGGAEAVDQGEQQQDGERGLAGAGVAEDHQAPLRQRQEGLGERGELGGRPLGRGSGEFRTVGEVPVRSPRHR